MAKFTAISARLGLQNGTNPTTINILNGDIEDKTLSPIFHFPKPSSLTSIIEIESDGKPLFILKPDGAIEVSNGFTCDAAARLFWEAIRQAAPSQFSDR